MCSPDHASVSWRLLALTILFAISFVGCSADTDSRLCGKWEGRQGFARTVQVEFQSDGKLQMTSSTGGQAEVVVNGRWEVNKRRGSNELVINLFGKGKTEQRVIKFKDSGVAADALALNPDQMMARLSQAAGVRLSYYRPMSGEANIFKLPEPLPLVEVEATSAAL